jgi:hypothetical protein
VPRTRTADTALEQPQLADRRNGRLELVEYELAGDRAARRISELGSRWAAWFADRESNTIGVLEYR